MIDYVLVIGFYAGLFAQAAQGVSVSSLPVTFTTEAECALAGNKIKAAFEDKAKWAGFICIQHTVPVAATPKP